MVFTVAETFYCIEAILSIQVIISSLELLNNRYIFKDAGLLSWRISRLYHPEIAVLTRKVGIDFLFQYPNIMLLLLLRTFIAVMVLISIFLSYSTFVLFLLLTVITLLLTLRSPQSNDGSDQMASILILTCTIAEGVPAVYGKEISIFFIVAQSSLAYATSGFLKLTKKDWQNGKYVTEILKTSSFGNRYLLQQVLKKKYLAKVFGCGVAYGDSVLAFAFAFPPKMCLALLAFGSLLHIGIGLVMGLNNFLWSFGATYPAVYFTSLRIHGFV